SNVLPCFIERDIACRLADDQCDFTFKRQQLSARWTFYNAARFCESTGRFDEVARILRPASTLCRPGLKSHMDGNHFARIIREERRHRNEVFLSAHCYLTQIVYHLRTLVKGFTAQLSR